MNPDALKKVGQVVVGFGLLFATALAFQNCSGYAMYDANTQTDLSSSCVTNCGPTSIDLMTTSQRITLLQSDLPVNRRVVDLGGYCDDGDFAESLIEYQFIDGSTPVTGWENSSTACDEIGKFQIAATVPASSRVYTLNLRLRAGANGMYVYSPFGGSGRSITIEVKN